MQMKLIAFVFFKVNVEQWPFELNPAREVFGFSSCEQPSPKRKKPQSSYHLVGQVLAFNQRGTAAGEFG